MNNKMIDKKRLKELECKYVTEKMKLIIAQFNMEHIFMENLVVIRSTTQDYSEPLHIYPFSKTLSYVLDIYYVIEVQPSFDLLFDYQQYRAIFHVLKHIPKDYKKLPRILPHTIEIFDGEENFDKLVYKQNLGLRGDYDG